MKFLFLLTEFPYPSHRNGIALINLEILKRIPADITVDLLISCSLDEINERSLRSIAPNINNIYYTNFDYSKIRQVISLISHLIIGKNLFVDGITRSFIRNHRNEYSVFYVSPLATFVDLTDLNPLFLNAVDSFTRLRESVLSDRPTILNLIKYHLNRVMEFKSIRRAIAINYVSKVDWLYVQKYANTANLLNISNGVDFNYFKKENINIQQGIKLLFTGNFAYKPNSEAAIYFANIIFPEILKIYPKSVFYVVGKNPPYELCNLKNIVTTGFVDDIRPYYHNSTIFVCPLKIGAGIKNKILEAIASELPIVSTDVGVEGIVGLSHRDNILIANSVSDFVASVLELIENTHERVRLAENAYSILEKYYSWDVVVKQYIDAMKDCSFRKKYGQ